MNTFVSFKLAQLIKEKGFDEECNNYYSQALFEGTNPDWEGVFSKYSIFKHSDYHYNSRPNFNDLWFECSAPTIAEVVMWIYKKYGIWIYARPVLSENAEFVFKGYIKLMEVFKAKEYQTGNTVKPIEAYEAAIEHVLQNLIK